MNNNKIAIPLIAFDAYSAGATDNKRYLKSYFETYPAVLDETLQERIKRQIRSKASARHVPNEVLQVTEIPRTLSGKKDGSAGPKTAVGHLA